MRGRPSHPPKPGARNSLGLKVTAETKRKLLEAARQSGRTMSQEAEARIERSFVDDETSARVIALMRPLIEEQSRDLKELANTVQRMRALQ